MPNRTRQPVAARPARRARLDDDLIGDSGGPFAAGNYGYGIASLANLCPTSGVWYDEVVPMAGLLGVHVASAG